MTENESLKTTLQNAIDCATDDFTREDLEMMVKCLEELQQYRAIGTVEELQKLKGVITDFPLDCGSPIKSIAEIWNQLKKYLAIGTIEEFKALKEKNEEKKVIVKGQGHEADCYCPNCNTFLGNDQDWSYDQTKCCSECGQALADY